VDRRKREREGEKKGKGGEEGEKREQKVCLLG